MSSDGRRIKPKGLVAHGVGSLKRNVPDELIGVHPSPRYPAMKELPVVADYGEGFCDRRMESGGALGAVMQMAAQSSAALNY